MKSLFLRFATPLTTGLFLVSMVSGTALFFHLGPSGFHAMHEWLSMVLIVPIGLHLWRNWRAFAGYFRRAPMAVALAASLSVAGVFLVPGDQAAQAGPPQFRLARLVLQSTPEELAPILGVSQEVLLGQLQAHGLPAVSSGVSVKDMADSTGMSDAELASALLALVPAD